MPVALFPQSVFLSFPPAEKLTRTILFSEDYIDCPGTVPRLRRTVLCAEKRGPFHRVRFPAHARAGAYGKDRRSRELYHAKGDEQKALEAAKEAFDSAGL
jgi:hypothetical protein